MGSLESDTTERLRFHFLLSCIGEGNGNPLQCSRLENPRDRGAWWASVYGVAQSWTQLRQLSSSKGLTEGFPGGSVWRICLQCRRHRFDPWVRKTPGKGNGNPLQHYCLGNSMDRGAWCATVSGVAKSWTLLSDWTTGRGFIFLCFPY